MRWLGKSKTPCFLTYNRSCSAVNAPLKGHQNLDNTVSHSLRNEPISRFSCEDSSVKLTFCCNEKICRQSVPVLHLNYQDAAKMYGLQAKKVLSHDCHITLEMSIMPANASSLQMAWTCGPLRAASTTYPLYKTFTLQSCYISNRKKHIFVTVSSALENSSCLS